MKFSILIANYNNGKFFQDCYKSILQQTYQNWEVVILDDASTDNSVEVIKNIIQKRFLIASCCETALLFAQALVFSFPLKALPRFTVFLMILRPSSG